ncbi:MAG: type VI secretion system baseplate subunit TssG [Chitinivibrionales bacterium]|nr:type VI secretion system baseplate subunit TssG [Chitinivibrionales bacterium]
MGNLTGRLLKEGNKFNFFQALSLLEEKFRSEGLAEDPVDSGRIRMEPECVLDFPPGDIAGITEDKGVITFILSFMELAGVSSPLPVYFTEYINTDPENAQPLKDFITIFNHRLYTLFYRAWKKYFLLQSTFRKHNDPLVRRIAAMTGIDSLGSVAEERMGLLAYCGVLAGPRRSAAGLQTMLSDVFGGIPVEVESWVPRWADVSDPKQIGTDAQLGRNTLLGTKIWDIAGKFRIIIGPLTRDIFEAFLSGTENIRRMEKLIEDFTADPLDFDIQVKLQSSDLVPSRLGANNAPLGRTSALGKSSGKSDIQTVTIGR